VPPGANTALRTKFVCPWRMEAVRTRLPSGENTALLGAPERGERDLPDVHNVPGACPRRRSEPAERMTTGYLKQVSVG
jgi:hypothetical protein